MVDISMCRGELEEGKTCPKRNECYRYRARPSEFLQSYLQAPYKDGYCAYHIRTDGWANLRTIEECEKPKEKK